MISWKPISTAPKDGQSILLTDGNDIRLGYWKEFHSTEDYRDAIGWVCPMGFSMNWPHTHWMPLPELPNDT